MNMLIGGLLVMTLLGSPEYARADYYAYELSNDGAIEILMMEIEDNKRYISKLVNEKNDIFEKLNKAMNAKAMKRQSVSDEFILEFQNLNGVYIEEREGLHSNIEIVLNTDFKDIQKEILHSDTNYSYIISEFSELIENQNSIINFLENITNKGRRALALC